MTQAFLEPTIIDKSNIDLFLKAISKESIEKVKKIDKEREKRKDEIEAMMTNRLPVEEIMKKYLDEEWIYFIFITRVFRYIF